MQSVLQSPPAANPVPEAGVCRQISIQTVTEWASQNRAEGDLGWGDEIGCDQHDLEPTSAS